MHFLSHYYTEPAGSKPLFVAGLIVPDLTPGFSKIHNSVVSKMQIPENENLQQLHQGIQHHYAGDKWFHASALFNQKIKDTTESFLKEGLSRAHLRLSVLAHVAVEMLIDRQILLQNPEICTEFYRLVEAADEKAIEQYFDALGEPLAKQRFFSTFRFFKQKKFLWLFNEIENVVFGLNRVYQLVTNTEFTEQEKEKLAAALHNIDVDMRYSWYQILNNKL